MATITGTRRAGTADWNSRIDPNLSDMGELAARISNVGLGSVWRSSAPQVVKEGFEDVSSLTARWVVAAVGAGATTIAAPAFAGITACKMVTGAVLNNQNQIYRHIAGIQTAWGFEAMIGIYGGAAAKQKWQVDMELVMSPGAGLHYVDGLLRLRSHANGDGMYDLAVLNAPTAAEVIIATNFILGANATDVTWHNLKFVVDALSKAYVYVLLDDQMFTSVAASALHPAVTTDTGFHFDPIVTVKTLAAQAATVHIDDLIVTRDEE